MGKVSPFAPKVLPHLPAIDGVRFASCAAGIRYPGRTDLLLALFEPGTTVAGVLTKSKTASAPVEWCRSRLEHGMARALVVNSGNANAFTGKRGREAVKLTAEAAAEAARAIMTTDTYPKLAMRQTEIEGVPVTINGIAKGAGMIAPDMATMLAFLFTDAAIEPAALRACLDPAVDETFNAITIDGDTSTSDTALIFATGRAVTRGSPRIGLAHDPRLAGFRLALTEVLRDLAHQ